ncbi:MAG TPA: SUMF1/EgtB/PvdO family nonheme iron enzyme [Labilithrix sp.]|jgi:hypothetical protein
MSTGNLKSTRKRMMRIAGACALVVGIPGISAASLTAASQAPEPTPTAMMSLGVVVTPHEVEHAPGACPRNMAHVGHSCVDKFEGSLVEILEDGSEVPYSAYQAPNGHKVRAVSRRGVAPQGHISMVEAQRACKASGKRLCHANEWKTACKGPEQTRYPYGNERKPNACTDTNRTSPMTKLYGGERSARTMNDPRANQVENSLAQTGDAESCTNDYGTHDMVGNIHEWTDDGSFRGGYYLDTTLNGEGCDYRTTRHAPSYYDYSTGFRCCADEGSVPEGDES